MRPQPEQQPCTGSGRPTHHRCRLRLPAFMLAWLALAWVARRYAETDLTGWQVAEWFAHRGKWLVFALAGLGATAMVALRRDARPNWRVAGAVTIICAGILGLTLWRTIPVHIFLDDEVLRGPHGELRQTVEYTCAPVSLGNLLSLLRASQDPATEKDLALLSGTTVEGTPLAALIRAAECFGLRLRECRTLALPELERHGGPALVTISTLPSVRHMTLLAGFSAEGVRFIDPAYGHQTISRERFQKIWYGKTLIFE